MVKACRTSSSVGLATAGSQQCQSLRHFCNPTGAGVKSTEPVPHRGAGLLSWLHHHAAAVDHRRKGRKNMHSIMQNACHGRLEKQTQKYEESDSTTTVVVTLEGLGLIEHC